MDGSIERESDGGTFELCRDWSEEGKLASSQHYLPRVIGRRSRKHLFCLPREALALGFEDATSISTAEDRRQGTSMADGSHRRTS